MRDEYIKLIKEYIKSKPEYRHTLEEIKLSVLSVGATEDEFNEAVKELTGIPDASLLIDINKPDTGYQKGQEEQNLPKEENLSKKASRYYYLDKLINAANLGKKRLYGVYGYKRGSAAIFSLIVIIFILAVFAKTRNNPEKISQPVPRVVRSDSLKSSNSIQSPIPVPIVYANSMPVDAKKVFSYPSSNIVLTVTNKPKKEIFGFFPYWMMPEENKININMLTSISLFGLNVDGKGNIITQDSNGPDGGWSMWKDPKLDSLIGRARSQNINVYLTFKSFDNDIIKNLALSDNAQKNFIANAIYLVNSKNLDGINLDFEYTGDYSQSVRDGFTRLVTNLNAQLKRQVPNANLTIDTYLVSGSEQGIFDIPLLARQAGALVIMGYDMHTPLGKPGPISAMGGATNIIGYVQGYLEQVPAEKLILAVPYYGYDWPQANDASPSASLVKILPYAQIAQESKNYTLSWDDTSQTPFYTYTDNGTSHIVHFDNVRSLGIKYDFIIRKNLKGVGIWALGYDGLNSDLERLLIDKFSGQ